MKEREKNMMCERHSDRLPLSCPQLGTWPATRACALTGNRISDLSALGPELSPLSHTSQDLHSGLD